MVGHARLAGLAALASVLVGCPTPGDDDDQTTAPDDDAATVPEELRTIAERCEQAPTVPEGFAWTGLLSDVHVHVHFEAEHIAFAEDLLQEMNETGVSRAVLQGSDRAPAEARQGEDEAWAPIVSVCPRLLYLVGGFEPDDPEAVHYIRERLDEAPFAGIGEINVHRTDDDYGVDPASAPMLDIYALAEERGVVVSFHADSSPEKDEVIMQMVTDHPDAGFVWFPCDFEAWPAGGFPDNLACNHPVIDTLVPEHVDDTTLLEITALGSDSAPAGHHNPAAEHLPYDHFAGAMLQARELLGELDVSDELKEGIAHGNLDRVFGE